MKEDAEAIKRLRAEFDEWADSYDAEMAAPTGVLVGYDEARRQAAALVAVEPGDRVADIGIGTGLFAELFDARGVSIVGVDLSPRMLYISAAKHPSWRLLEGHFLQLPLPSGSMDLVVSAFASHHLETAEWPDALLEVLRVLKPSGRVLLVDIMFADAAAKDAARARLGDEWEDENYPLYTHVAQVAHELGVQSRFELLSSLHAAVVFEPKR
jgi:putative AdoMet-dependent methyltransferase